MKPWGTNHTQTIAAVNEKQRFAVVEIEKGKERRVHSHILSPNNNNLTVSNIIISSICNKTHFE
jgi:hypothetical protein